MPRTQDQRPGPSVLTASNNGTAAGQNGSSFTRSAPQPKTGGRAEAARPPLGPEAAPRCSGCPSKTAGQPDHTRLRRGLLLKRSGLAAAPLLGGKSPVSIALITTCPLVVIV